jgi:hypothetical protein
LAAAIGLRAAKQAVGDAVRGADLQQSYRRRLKTERAADEYDGKYFRNSRIAGQVVGTGAQIAALGPIEGMVAGGARIAQATPLIAREVATLGGVGAAAGVGGQAVGDGMRGTVGSAGDYVGAALGGATGAFVSRYGLAGYAGAAAGGATSISQDMLNRRVKSVDDALHAIDRARAPALAGGALGVVGGAAGRAWADDLSRRSKEMLGEEVSALRTRVRGDRTLTRVKSREYLPGGKHKYTDQRTLYNWLVESKAGRFARLSPNQNIAYLNLDNYRVDHVLPRDVGAIWGAPLSITGYQAFDQ